MAGGPEEEETVTCDRGTARRRAARVCPLPLLMFCALAALLGKEKRDLPAAPVVGTSTGAVADVTSRKPLLELLLLLLADVELSISSAAVEWDRVEALLKGWECGPSGREEEEEEADEVNKLSLARGRLLPATGAADEPMLLFSRADVRARVSPPLLRPPAALPPALVEAPSAEEAPFPCGTVAAAATTGCGRLMIISIMRGCA